MYGVIELTGKIYSDLTDKLPFKSLTGNICILVMYDYNSNVILTRAIKFVKGNHLSMHMKYYKTAYESKAQSHAFKKPTMKIPTSSFKVPKIKN